jgi:hypothetical protein
MEMTTDGGDDGEGGEDAECGWWYDEDCRVWRSERGSVMSGEHERGVYDSEFGTVMYGNGFEKFEYGDAGNMVEMKHRTDQLAVLAYLHAARLACAERYCRGNTGYKEVGLAHGRLGFESAGVYEEVQPVRRSSGLIARYTGSEPRLAPGPSFGWDWRAGREQRLHGEASGEYGSRVAGRMAPHGYSEDSKGNAPLTASACSLSDEVRALMKMMPVFSSDTVTLEKARKFWWTFEGLTEGLPDRSRLLVFRKKVTGRAAEKWLENSRIKSFEVLKARFHRRFLTLTEEELWKRFREAKRESGESVEEWADRVNELCGSMKIENAKARFQRFRRGLGNKRAVAILDACVVNDIRGACELLMMKDLYRPPVEQDDGVKSGCTVQETETLVLISVEELSYAVAKTSSAGSRTSRLCKASADIGKSPERLAKHGRGESGPLLLGNREEASVGSCGVLACDRCGKDGHSRGSCPRQTLKCRRCGLLGHIGTECTSSLRRSQGRTVSAAGTVAGSGRHGQDRAERQAGRIERNAPLVSSGDAFLLSSTGSVSSKKGAKVVRNRKFHVEPAVVVEERVILDVRMVKGDAAVVNETDVDTRKVVETLQKNGGEDAGTEERVVAVEEVDGTEEVAESMVAEEQCEVIVVEEVAEVAPVVDQEEEFMRVCAAQEEEEEETGVDDEERAGTVGGDAVTECEVVLERSDGAASKRCKKGDTLVSEGEMVMVKMVEEAGELARSTAKSGLDSGCIGENGVWTGD